MESILVSSTVFLVVFGGALVGMRLRRVLPQNQLGPEVKDVIRLVTGLLVTMTALVLGMLVSTANSSYQQRKDQLTEMASDFVGVDRLLGSYGPETQPAREELHSLAEASLQRIWPNQGSQDPQLRPTDTGQIFYNQLQLLQPKNEAQVAVKAAAISGGHCPTAHLLVNVPRIRGELPLSSATGGCGRVADCHLRQLRAFRSAQQHSIRDASRLRSRRFRRRLCHHGHVYAVQRRHEDFVFAPSRCTHPDDTLSAANLPSRPSAVAGGGLLGETSCRRDPP